MDSLTPHLTKKVILSEALLKWNCNVIVEKLPQPFRLIANMPQPIELSSLFLGDAPVAILVFEREHGTIISINRAAEMLYGFTAAELVNRSIFDTVTDEEHTRFRLKQACAGRIPAPYRKMHRRADGTLVAVTVALGRCGPPNEHLLVKYIIDATDAEQTEHELVATQHRFRAIADYTYDWETWLDPSGRLIWVNPAVERLAGYSVQECMGMADYPMPIIAQEDRSKVQQLIAGALAGSSGNDVEFRITRKDSQQKWIAVSWQPLLSTDQLQIGIRMSMRDIDDRKAMEQQLRTYMTELEQLVADRAAQIVHLESEKSKIERLAALGKLAAAVSHEINNPLAGIRNAFQLLRIQANLSPENLELVELIDKEIERMTRVLRQMTQLYRPSTSSPSVFDLVDITKQIATLLSGELSSREVSLALGGQGKSFPVKVPEIEFRQILHNLLINAIEASGRGDQVLIDIDSHNHETFSLKVRDFGIGLDPSILDRIFEPFFTTKNSPSRPGSGLGLAISKSLASAIGVGLEIIPCEGRGACFQLLIPKAQRTEPLS